MLQDAIHGAIVVALTGVVIDFTDEWLVARHETVQLFVEDSLKGVGFGAAQDRAGGHHEHHQRHHR